MEMDFELDSYPDPSPRSVAGNFRKLIHKRNYVLSRIDKAHDENGRINGVVIEWLDEVDKLVKEMNDVEEEKTDEWCSGITKKIKSLDAKSEFDPFYITSEMNNYQLPSLGVKTVYTPLGKYDPQNGRRGPGTSEDAQGPKITTESGESFPILSSQDQARGELLKALQDDRYHTIGLVGKRGSGKTTLVNTTAKTEYQNIFDTVVFVNVSEKVDIVNIQNQITPQFHMNSQAFRSQSKRASAIESTLSKDHKCKVLVIIDHVWTNFTPQYLEEIGIPGRSKRCKILLITHDKKYCNTVECHIWVPLHPLPNKDAWKLLQQISGIDPEYSSPDLVHVAHEVVVQCKGLPRVITDVVTSLNNLNTEDDTKLQEYWRETLDCLKHETARYQIFISFRGTDTRDDFTESLYDALDGAGFKVFIDRKIRSGDRVSETLIKVIEQSRTSIVVLSENYAQSSWCLDELLKIMECREKLKQLVYPIFYKVDPSNVRHVKGTYKEAMAKKEERFGKDKVQQWTSALYNVAAYM